MYASPPKSHHLECQGQNAEHSQAWDHYAPILEVLVDVRGI
jgi:hypothetical protein